MHRVWAVAAITACLDVVPIRAQHPAHHESASGLQVGARVIGLVTHAAPAITGENQTEAYVTQPTLAVSAAFRDAVQMVAMLNLEGITLRRGELNHGVWGEGYVDRRHPHTFLHEAVVSIQHHFPGIDVSLSAGRGFAGFGTDDPMVRPFVKYPVNHHLSHILERLIAVGAMRYGPLTVEGSVFSGDEPTSPEDLGTVERFGDSWAVRITLEPLEGLELQSSVAAVESPERPSGGLDHHKRNFSVRIETPMAGATTYGLLEHARTAELHEDVEAFVFTSVLAEAGLTVKAWQLAVRFENTTRPEEERTANLFRSVRPTSDNSILGRTRWQNWTASAGYEVRVSGHRFTPFLEVTRAAARATDRFPVNTPEAMYGSARIWNLSAGMRFATGMRHTRMGRYGAANRLNDRE